MTVIGGSPLRLFRLTPAGGQLFAAIAAGDPIAPSRLSEQLLDTGAIHPLQPDVVSPTEFVPADITVVVPTHETPPARLYEILSHCLETAGVMFVDDGSGTPLTGVRGATLVRLRHNSGPAAARNAGRAPPKRRSSPSSTPTSSCSTDGSTACSGTLTTRESDSSLRELPAEPPPRTVIAASPVTSNGTRRSIWVPSRRASPPGRGSATSPPRR